MKNFKNRADYFELEKTLEETANFSDKVKTVKIISNWASAQMGYDAQQTEAYTRSHIANIVRENEVAKMLKRIQNDLSDNNLDIDDDALEQKACDLINDIAITGTELKY